MIELKGTIIIPSIDFARAEKPLADHIEATRIEPGCIVFEVTQDQDNPELFHVFEQFVDQASFDHHQELGKTREWGSIAQSFIRDFSITEI